MKIRDIRWADKPDIDRIYREFYSNNEYPTFLSDKPDQRFPCSFIVEDEDEKVIVAGGVKTIAEAVFLTDKNFSPRVRLDALLHGLGSSIFIAQGMKHRQIHAFVNNDERYVSVLKKFGFKEIDAKLLVLDFGEPHNG
jgi:hypothetical protein